MPSRKTLIKNADQAMSRYIRLRDADFSGYVYCVTCGKAMYWEKDGAQMGHYMPKGNGASAVRYIPHNAHVQCSGCNMHKSGDLVTYSVYMAKNYGLDAIDDLLYRKSKVMRYSDDDLIEIANLYTELGDILSTDKTLLGFTYG